MAEVTEVIFKCMFVYFLLAEFLFKTKTSDQTFYLFIAKAHNEQGILLIHWKLA